jgi:hypothetical protein
LKNIVVIDAGPLISLFDRKDAFHLKVVDCVAQCRADKLKFISTWPVISEAAYMIVSRVHLGAQLDFLEWIGLGGVEIFDLTDAHLPRIQYLQKKYSSLPMDFADATVVTAAEELGVAKVITLDPRDFLKYSLPHRGVFQNILKK